MAPECAKEYIRFNAVTPGIVDTPLHVNDPKDFLKTLSPMGTIATVEDIASAVVYLTEASQVCCTWMEMHTAANGKGGG